MPALPIPAVTATAPLYGPPAPPSTTPPALPQQNQEADEDLVLQLMINDTEMQDFVEGLKHNGKVYLPLAQLSQLLDFEIKVDAAKKTASGWFIHENNKLSITETSADVKGQKYTLTPADMIAKDQDLLIDSALLQKWLPLDFTVDLLRMSLNIHPREPLPYQDEQARLKKYAKLTQQKSEGQNIKEAKLQKIETAYEGAQWPAVDLTFAPTYDSASKTKQANYSVLAGGDFGYLTTHLYAAGNLEDNNSISDLRLSLGRDDYERNLLGPLHASSYLMGDISSAGLSQVTSGSGQGRGFTMTNRALDRPDKFGTTSFVGDSKPGWQVELYRNDVLINFLTIDTTGRYVFQDIPVLFGNNVFRLEFYGPQGQRESITKNVNTSDTLLRKGDFTYNVSADQAGQSLFGISDTTTLATRKPNTPRMVGEFEYGLTSNVTATAGTAHTTIGVDGHDYGTAGLHMTFAGMLLGVDNAYDAKTKGRSTLASLTTRAFDTDIKLDQRIVKDFVSEADSSSLTDPITSQTSLDLGHQFSLPFVGPWDNDLITTRKFYVSKRVEDLVTYRFSKSFFGLKFSNELNYDHDNLGVEQMLGSFTAHGTYNKLELGLQGNYGLYPLKEFNSAKLTALFPINDRVTNLATLTDTLTGTKSIQLEDTVTVDMKRYKISFTGRGDDQNNYFVGVTFNVSLNKIPQTNDWIISSKPLVDTGVVAVRPYLDMNYNLKYDQGDKQMPDALLKVGTLSAQQPNNKGLILATQLPVNTPLRVSMSQDAQKNPYLASASGDYQVVPRAGKIIFVDFPLIEVSQIDGTVHVPPGISPAGLRVDLLNTEGQPVNSTHTAFDGYYLLEGIMPGTYTLRISIDDLAARHIKQPDVRTVTVKSSDFYVQDMALAGEEATSPVIPAKAGIQ
jgi:hypothetical protein